MNIWSGMSFLSVSDLRQCFPDRRRLSAANITLAARRPASQRHPASAAAQKFPAE
jgi:hypothetical protein